MLKILGGNGLYITLMADEKSVYPILESGYAFEKDMIARLVNAGIIQNFTKIGAILRTKCYKPEVKITQNLRSEEKVRKIEVIRLKMEL